MSWGPEIRPTRAEIDQSALVENARALASWSACALFAVVKADAYGHGAVDCARALEDAKGVQGLAVSLVEEGAELRAAGIMARILVMGPSFDGGYDELLARGLTPLVSDLEDLAGIARAAAKAGRTVDVHLKLDTGMGRLGLQRRDGERLRALCGQAPLRVTGLATHFACADLDDPEDPDSTTRAQLREFEVRVAELRGQLSLGPVELHAANSAGLMFFPDARFSLARPGLALYGNGPRPEGLVLRQVASLRSRITQLRTIERGQSVSYGRLWRAERDSVLGVVPVGYADGLPRNMTGRAECLLRGVRCPLVGAISMDITLVDVTELGDDVARGDEVVLLGGSGPAAISTQEFAGWAGITPYEVTCGLSKRVPRHVWEDGHG